MREAVHPGQSSTTAQSTRISTTGVRSWARTANIITHHLFEIQEITARENYTLRISMAIRSDVNAVRQCEKIN
jgi:hypothetical protein